MPIWLRRYTYNTIKEFYLKEKEEYDKQSGAGQQITGATGLPKLPPTQSPTYSTKAPKK